MLDKWQLQEAKNKFSHVVKQAQQGKPQYITVHCKPTAVVVSVEDYRKLSQPKTSLSEALMIPLMEQEFDFARDRDTGRKALSRDTDTVGEFKKILGDRHLAKNFTILSEYQ